MHKSYKDLAEYYDAMHIRRDYRKEVDFILKAIADRTPKANSIVDVGCGTGTHLNLLLESGHFDKLVGVDKNKEILDVARKKSKDIEYVQALMSNFDLDTKFDALTCLLSVLNYNLTYEEAEATMTNFAKNMNSGGTLVMGLYSTHNVDKKVSIHLGEGLDFKAAKINQYSYDPETKLETTDFLVFWKKDGKVDFEIETGHKYRIFDNDELTQLLRKTGFGQVVIYDNYTEELADSKSNYPVVVATKE